MEEAREKIKKEILELFGENVYQIFSNNQGSPNESEFLNILSFQEVIALNNDSSRGSIKELIREYDELKIYNTIDFLESFQKFIITSYKKDEKMTEIEKSFGSEKYRHLLMKKSIEIFDSNQKIILPRVLNKIENDEKIANIFKTDICQGQDLSQIENKELRNKLIIFSKEIIFNSLDILYREYRLKPINDFNLIFNTNLFENILNHISN